MVALVVYALNFSLGLKTTAAALRVTHWWSTTGSEASTGDPGNAGTGPQSAQYVTTRNVMTYHPQAYSPTTRSSHEI